MAGTTTRGAIRYPNGGDPPDIDGDLRELAEDVAARFALYGQGTAAQRPAAAANLVGMLYRSTDTGTVEWCSGSAWVPVSAVASASLGFAELFLHGGS